MTARDAVRDVYAQVAAPEWAAPNLDGLLDVLRDLSWLPEGRVAVTAPPDEAVRAVLRQAADETADGPRPVVLRYD
jgi:hypothetical protein